MNKILNVQCVQKNISSILEEIYRSYHFKLFYRNQFDNMQNLITCKIEIEIPHCANSLTAKSAIFL